MLRALSVCLLCSLAPWAGAASVDAESAWIRAAPPTARMLAGYVVLHNRGSEPVALVGASSARFGLVEVHETVDVDGVARMREVPRIDIAPGGSAALQPGGRHLMLMRPSGVPAKGEQVQIVLRFSDASELPVSFIVSPGAPGAQGTDNGHHSGHGHR